ncbi:NAD(P)/FAD-dependent oxidoreductase [Enemella evansiae]|uniref:NAD(P)/FAD-dependent oxidoreductase n=1 Tax=Enemella evansiae TaxID=2016499 RepID=UPI000B977FEF|nr:NADH dehydrogenase FAD-containing subunit [Enemella evansiae]PFG68732.1 NADH dehydrogenase [Propionibacteriaceae bacterium ES.041]OYN96571.1 NADH dehydrogenase FAD-containing subunit [Enemella evansiae]OYO03374.1 NADH dehydrogenase FAD-containing subunit [Enemella evansiae]OYO09794.1 NADH dehydrogenase FAD-containing subunit [Enemella evansiae]
MGPVSAPHIVVVGAGFAGLNATNDLAAAGARVTLVDRHPYTTFQPLLYQVATGGLNPGDVTFSLRALAAKKKGRVRFRRANVTGIDTENKKVLVDQGSSIDYDYLVLAQGVGANFFGIPGASEYARSIYTRAEALEVRDLMFGLLEKLAVAPANQDLSVVVVGGGATGVEMAGTLAEMRSQGLPVAYPEVNPARVRVMLVEMGPVLLSPFKEDLQRYTLRQLQKRGVDVRLDTAIAEVRPGEVEFSDGTKEKADLVVWAAGIGGHDLVKKWGMPQGRGGRIVTEPTLQVKGFTDIFAVGDAAIIEQDPLPQLAQPAIQEGKLAAHNIRALDHGQPLKTMEYHDRGTMATIGRSSAVVQLPGGINVTGLPAWGMWVALHLAELLGGRNRIQAMINLGFRYLLYPKSANAIVGDLADSKTGELPAPRPDADHT